MFRIPLLLLALSALVSESLRAQDPPPPPPPAPPPADSARADSGAVKPDSAALDSVGIYSEEQAKRGESIYSQNCVECHSSANYTGSAFRRAWGGKPAFDFWEQIRTTMPEDDPGKLSLQEYADIVAYLLKLNKLPAGPAELPAEPDKLQQLMIRVSRPGG